MKFCKILIFGAMALAIASCVSTPVSNSVTQTSQPSIVKFRFQNMLGLKLYYAGCSFKNLGGVERLCQFAQENPSDLTFQIGPSFSELLAEPETARERESKRNALWKIWEILKVEFYSVDARDLSPSLKAFQKSHLGSQIALLSTNLVSEQNTPLFETYRKKEILGKRIVFLSFSEASESSHGKSWKVEPIQSAFQKVKKEMESQTDIFYVLGALNQSTRSEISSMTSIPVLFLGGAMEENNTIRLEPIAQKDFSARAANFGRGFGEIAVGVYEKDFWGRAPQASLGGLSHSFWSYLLEPVDLKFNQCSKILETTKPQPLPTEALKVKNSN